MPIQKGLIFAYPEGSCFYQSGGVPIFANPEGSLFLPIRRGPIFVNPEGSLFLPIRRGPYFCQSGGVLFLSMRRGIVLSRLKKTTEKKVVKGFRLLRDRLGIG